jgi:hypothetical protein
MSRKVFTAGEVLAAADVNSFLMDQTVMSFAGTAARGSAIPSPVEGMMSYLEDTNDIQVYNGSAYTSTLGAVLLANLTASGAGVQFQNIFTSQYNHYKIIFNISSTSNARPVFQLMSGASVISSNYRVNYEWGTTSRTISSSASTTDMTINDAGYGTNASFSGEFIIFNPALAAETAYLCQSMGREAAGNVTRPQWQTACGHHGVSSSYDGIYISMTATMSGTIQIYGMRI